MGSGDHVTRVKCVVWDLDGTLWHGVLLEDEKVKLRGEVVEVIKTLDSRGILHSIASKNDRQVALDKLEALGVREYFLYPQIGWGTKSSAVAAVAKSLNIGIDTLAFIDDQEFERDEVSSVHPNVLCIAAEAIATLPTMPQMSPRFITPDSASRRLMYMADQARNDEETSFDGPQEDFLAGLQMVFQIFPARKGDLERAEELTVRTHQLNSTGYTYSYEELDALRQADDHLLLVGRLDDKYGAYGTIGVALVHRTPSVWTLKLLLASCRVMSRGVGSVMLNHIIAMAHAASAELQAEFVPTDRNRLMYITYKFAGFTEIDERNGVTVLAWRGDKLPEQPNYLTINTTPMG